MGTPFASFLPRLISVEEAPVESLTARLVRCYAAELAGFNIDLAFISASSFDLRGLSVPTEGKAIVKRSIAEHADRCVLVADSSKYGRVSTFKALPLRAFDAIVKDWSINGVLGARRPAPNA